MSLPADLSSPALAPEAFAGTDAPWIDPVSRLLWWLMAGAALALAVAVWQLGFRIRQLEYGAAYLLALAAIGLLFRRRGRIGAGAFLECLAQFLLVGILLGLLALVIAAPVCPIATRNWLCWTGCSFPTGWRRAAGSWNCHWPARR